MSLYAFFKGTGPSGFGYGSTASDVVKDMDLEGKTYLLTGCNSGLGLETLRALGGRGAFVIATARTSDKAQAALDETRSLGHALACELSEPSSVRAAVNEVQNLGRPLDGILCNAGIMALPKLTLQHGYEAQFFTNHIGHFLLVTGLLAGLAGDGRVVMVSSTAHKSAPKAGIDLDNLDGSQGYAAFRAYGQSKLANLLFARELARQFEGSGRRAYALHPGVIATKLGRHMNPVLWALVSITGPIALKTPAQGAATTTYLATADIEAALNGAYFADCNVARSSDLGQDMELAKKLWAKSEAIVAALDHVP